MLVNRQWIPKPPRIQTKGKKCCPRDSLWTAFVDLDVGPISPSTTCYSTKLAELSNPKHADALQAKQKTGKKVGQRWGTNDGFFR